MNNSLKVKDNKVRSAATTAGAFQDHIINELSIGDLSLCDTLKSYTGIKQRMKNDEKRRRHALKNIKPTIDTGRKRNSHSKGKMRDAEREYVLDPLPKPSLAQKMGLVPRPDEPLTSDEWMTVKERSIEREDFKHPCAICQEQFRTEDQVLLRCSHVFHKACIQAFERFTGKKTCPMCRKIQYQARVVHDGTKEYKVRAAIRIQSVWRGYVVRKWYLNLRRTVPPTNATLRKIFYEDKLQEITDRMVAMTNTETIDRFLEDIDASVASSRQIFKHFEDSCIHRLTEDDWIDIEVKALEREDADCPICLRSLLNQPSRKKSARSCKVKKSKDAALEKHKSYERYDPFRMDTSPDIIGTEEKKAALSLLSCSHLYHAQCLRALEDFSVSQFPIDGGVLNFNHSLAFQNHMNFRCPVCRSMYIKRDLYSGS